MDFAFRSSTAFGLGVARLVPAGGRPVHPPAPRRDPDAELHAIPSVSKASNHRYSEAVEHPISQHVAAMLSSAGSGQLASVAAPR